ncbi:MAG TPA: ABC transporter permease [Ilumatobacteraceae bacterium]
MNSPEARSRLRAVDAIRAGVMGWRTRRLRSVLTALGVAIGVAAVVAVAGITASSRAELLARIDRLGTGLLEVRAGQSVFGESTELPEESAAMTARIGPVEAATGTTTVPVAVRRSDRIPAEETGGLGVSTAAPDLIEVLRASVSSGRFLGDGDLGLPVTVLGAKAAERLGIDALDLPAVVDIGGHRFAVVGILDPVELVPSLDRNALIGADIAETLFDTSRSPHIVYARTAPDAVDAVRGVIPATVKPGAPEEVTVTRPSDALEARAVTDRGLTTLLLGLGGVALVVGGVGIANVMVVSVLERRSEIGLRRALGATRRHVGAQVLLEALVHSATGGAFGVLIGAGITAIYARSKEWPVDMPPLALVGGVGVAVVVGLLAGLAPAARAARLDPVAALNPV